MIGLNWNFNVVVHISLRIFPCESGHGISTNFLIYSLLSKKHMAWSKNVSCQILIENCCSFFNSPKFTEYYSMEIVFWSQLFALESLYLNCGFKVLYLCVLYNYGNISSTTINENISLKNINGFTHDKIIWGSSPN